MAIRATAGSSPLTRGKHLNPRRAQAKAGLIPAHAGKTPSREPHHADTRAHPRSRGENHTPRNLIEIPGGSSPLTRGKRLDARPHAVDEGLIPAHAGKTGRTSAPARPSPAHPRSRGENRTKTLSLSATLGSSPLTRGKRHVDQAAARLRGLIPAHAGKTRSCSSSLPAPGAHPRSRGENSMLKDRLRYEDGSSPLTRGKHARRQAYLDCKGLIPAHAGKTAAGEDRRVRQGAHPRSRGENYAPFLSRASWSGSSPLTRGKPSVALAFLLIAGLIPAHAGKTASRSPRPCPRGAHPRSRGENRVLRGVVLSVGGSSPLTRGKPQACRPA